MLCLILIFKTLLLQVANHPIDVEYIRLLHDIHADNIKGHPWRGYIILNSFQQDSIKEIQNYEDVNRPVWFIFSALGTHWPGMGTYSIFHILLINRVLLLNIIYNIIYN